MCPVDIGGLSQHERMKLVGVGFSLDCIRLTGSIVVAPPPKASFGAVVVDDRSCCDIASMCVGGRVDSCRHRRHLYVLCYDWR